MSNWKVGPGGRLYHPTTGAYVGQLDLNGNEQMVLGITTLSSGGIGFAPQIPVTLFSSGVPFLIPPGDGGANGLAFTGGGGGAFTLSAAILSFSFNVLSDCYIWLPANAGGSGCAAGWYYAQFSSDTAGIVYGNTYTSGVPIIPPLPIAFAGAPSGRITTTTAEITAQSINLPARAMGNNGTLEWWPRLIGTNSANFKQARLRAGGTEALMDQLSTAPDSERVYTVRNRGREDRQTCSRSTIGVGGAVTSMSGDWMSVDTSVVTDISITLKLSAVTDSIVLLSNRIVVTNFG